MIGTAEATLSDRDEPTLINHLMNVTAAFGLAIHEDWEYGFFQPLIALTSFLFAQTVTCENMFLFRGSSFEYLVRIGTPDNFAGNFSNYLFLITSYGCVFTIFD